MTTRRNSDMLPDGRLLGVSVDLPIDGNGDTTRRDQITVVLNWRQELDAKLSH